MRDPNRIPPLLDVLSQIWLQMPDIRFNQLIHNLQAEFHSKTEQGSKHYVTETDRDYFLILGVFYDLFNVEDDSFHRFLLRKLDELNDSTAL